MSVYLSVCLPAQNSAHQQHKRLSSHVTMMVTDDRSIWAAWCPERGSSLSFDGQSSSALGHQQDALYHVIAAFFYLSASVVLAKVTLDSKDGSNFQIYQLDISAVVSPHLHLNTLTWWWHVFTVCLCRSSPMCPLCCISSTASCRPSAGSLSESSLLLNNVQSQAKITKQIKSGTFFVKKDLWN